MLVVCFSEWGSFGSHRGVFGKPPLPKVRPSLPHGAGESLATEDVPSQMFKDLVDGKSEALQQFDELGILDPDRKVIQSWQLSVSR